MTNMKKENVIYVDKNDDLKTVMTCFKVNKISHVPVLSDKKIVGMVSFSDVINYLSELSSVRKEKTWGNLLQDIKVKEIMIQPVITASVDDSQMTILEKLFNHQVSSVIIKEGDEIKGIITDKDMLVYLASHFEKNVPFTEKLGFYLVDWLDKNGIIKISHMLSQIGI